MVLMWLIKVHFYGRVVCIPVAGRVVIEPATTNRVHFPAPVSHGQQETLQLRNRKGCFGSLEFFEGQGDTLLLGELLKKGMMTRASRTRVDAW